MGTGMGMGQAENTSVTHGLHYNQFKYNTFSTKTRTTCARAEHGSPLVGLHSHHGFNKSQIGARWGQRYIRRKS